MVKSLVKEYIEKHSKRNFYLYVIELLERDFNLIQIASRFKTSKQNLNYHIKPLHVNKVIEETSKGIWKVNYNNIPLLEKYKPVKVVKNTLGVALTGSTLKPNTSRGHAYVFTLKIPKIKNWENREKYLIKLKEKKKIKDYWKVSGGFGIEFRGHKIWLCNDSIVVYYPKGKSYYAERPLYSFLQAYYDFGKLITGLQRLLGIKTFTIQRKYWVSVSRSHIALIKNDLALHLANEKKKLEIRDEQGRLWLIADDSFNLGELEFPLSENNENIKQATTYQDFHNSFKEKPFTAYDFHKLEEENEELKLIVSESQKRLKEMSEEAINIEIVMKQMQNNQKTLIKEVFKDKMR